MKALAFALYLAGVLFLVTLVHAQACPDCPQPDRPWMRGSIEISCAHPAILARLRKENPGKTFKACKCEHVCDPTADHAAETDRRQWDFHCEARCNPKGCRCPHVCES